jgi:putative nucleotidyltransferase with HDIG domain
MDIKLIEKLEEEIKELHLNPKQKNHSFSDKSTKEFFSLFWSLHVKPVIDYSKELAKIYNGDLETLWLAAILHDISRLDDLEPHDKIGAQMAYKLLLERGFNQKTAEKVRDVIMTHRCKENKPQTLEQKLMATADAVIHFKAPFYLWWEHISKSDIKENFESGLKKIERDYKDKIFFEEEKESIRKEYEVLKGWFEYYSKIV